MYYNRTIKNKQIEYILKDYVKRYIQANGEIPANNADNTRK